MAALQVSETGAACGCDGAGGHREGSWGLLQRIGSRLDLKSAASSVDL